MAFRTLFLLLFHGVVVSAIAQGLLLQDHQILGNESYNKSRSISLGQEGGYFVCGAFVDSIVIDDDTLVTFNTNAAYMTRLDSDLTVMWSRMVAENEVSMGSFYMTVAAASDPMGNIIVGLSYADELYFFDDTVGQPGGIGIELLKLDPEGDLIWSRHIPGLSLGQHGVASNSAGDIFLTGNDSNNVFLLKYDSAGDILWSRSAGGPNSADAGISVAVDVFSNAYVIGVLGQSNSIYFDSLHVPITGAYNISFIAKYDPAGIIQWVRYVYSTLFAHPSVFSASACDTDGNVLLAGWYEDSTLRFSNGYPSAGSQFGGWPQSFLTAFDSNGNRLWVTIPPSTDNGTDGALDVELFGSYAVVLNKFTGLVPSAGGNMDNYGFEDLRIQTFSLSGGLLSDLQVGGTMGEHGDQLLAADDKLLALGWTYSTPLHVGADEIGFPMQGRTFVIELAQDPNAVPQHARGGSVHVFPNPSSGTVTVSCEHQPTNAQLMVRDALGRLVMRQDVYDQHTTLTLPRRGMHMVELWEHGVRLAVQRVVVD